MLIVTGLAHGLGRSGRLQLLVACVTVKIEQQRTKSGNAREEIIMIYKAHKIECRWLLCSGVGRLTKYVDCTEVGRGAAWLFRRNERNNGDCWPCPERIFERW